MVDDPIAAPSAGTATILAGIECVEHALKSVGGRVLLPAAEVTDWLLDIRQSLDRYYATPLREHQLRRAERDPGSDCPLPRLRRRG